jgi:hypothetical protein
MERIAETSPRFKARIAGVCSRCAGPPNMALQRLGGVAGATPVRSQTTVEEQRMRKDPKEA